MICALIGFPLAYIMARGGPTLRRWVIVQVINKQGTRVVVGTIGWMVVL